MKMLDLVCFEDQAVHLVDISLALEQKAALEARHTTVGDKSIIQPQLLVN
jgi:hypothetical protein